MAKIPTLTEQRFTRVGVPSAEISIPRFVSPLAGVAVGAQRFGASLELLGRRVEQAKLVNDTNDWQIRILRDVNNAKAESAKAAPGEQVSTYMNLINPLIEEIGGLREELKSRVLPVAQFAQERGRVRVLASEAVALSSQATAGFNELVAASVEVSREGSSADFLQRLDVLDDAASDNIGTGAWGQDQAARMLNAGKAQLFSKRISALPPDQAQEVLDSEEAQRVLSSATANALSNNIRTRISRLQRQADEDDRSDAAAIMAFTRQTIAESIAETGMLPPDLDTFLDDAFQNRIIAESFTTRDIFKVQFLAPEAIAAASELNVDLFNDIKGRIFKTASPQIRTSLNKAEATMLGTLSRLQAVDDKVTQQLKHIGKTGELMPGETGGQDVLNKVWGEMIEMGMTREAAMSVFAGREVPSDALSDHQKTADPDAAEHNLFNYVKTQNVFAKADPAMADRIAGNTPYSAAAWAGAKGQRIDIMTDRMKLMSDGSAKTMVDEADKRIPPDVDLIALFYEANETEGPPLDVQEQRELQNLIRYHMVEETIGRGNADLDKAFEAAVINASKEIFGRSPIIAVEGIGNMQIPINPILKSTADDEMAEERLKRNTKKLEQAINDNLLATVSFPETGKFGSLLGLAFTFSFRPRNQFELIPNTRRSVYRGAELIVPSFFRGTTQPQRILIFNILDGTSRFLERGLGSDEEKKEFSDLEQQVVRGRTDTELDPEGFFRYDSTYGARSPREVSRIIEIGLGNIAATRHAAEKGGPVDLTDPDNLTRSEEWYRIVTQEFGWLRAFPGD